MDLLNLFFSLGEESQGKTPAETAEDKRLLQGLAFTLLAIALFCLAVGVQALRQAVS